MTTEQLYAIYKEFPSVQTDTRKLKEGDIFFALKGENFNGNHFVEKAFETGASYAVIDDERYAVFGKTVLVKDVLTALQHLAAYHRRQFSIPFVAITGSNGKTTTKELVHAVLSSSFTVYTTEGNLNNHIGVPLTILKIKEDAEMAVIEMGANHIGEIASYCMYALPTHGLITNCGKAHLEGFGSEEGVRKAKGELFNHLRAHNGTAFIMKDYDYLREMSKGIPAVLSYGTQDADTEGHVLQSDPFLELNMTKGVSFGTIKTQLVGDYNLPNVLAVVAVGKHFNVDDEKIKTAIEEYIPSNSRSQLKKIGTNTIILDAYNANPSSMRSAIENFAHMHADHKVIMLGAMAELGQESQSEHQGLIDLIRKYNWQNVVLVGGDFLKIQHPFLQFENAAEARQWLAEQNLENTHLLIKGSRSMQMEKVLAE
ncbi:MAG TPA: UDP-N-acetylmuramoyl-tripeptide--D-alanyl-D-alanine ligase [Chitinophagaceae bacterium]|jgi:UDP-N-acetylmuramoyl-tripeptide--D-alanyl-D-alanine ligase|nr:UDP-N-acetylmuramoyl-tripeptide--D-alanyl-D-alanine ligase [Chitinophagaceae bacterium]